ncbi:hypothetical protein BT67DRAFT_150556 [Trichocladium antarcticum]|uniref:Uncharacterized protein n=1 Tax=Trichocladium antarcticum TaxID=1450529 RepID=A0AAN6UEW1_9PEZI|nr:hypothetical protein BT67DRAFT_150556 [Trichocladium antarcticum]
MSLLIDGGAPLQRASPSVHLLACCLAVGNRTAGKNRPLHGLQHSIDAAVCRSWWVVLVLVLGGQLTYTSVTVLV